jgi:transposase
MRKGPAKMKDIRFVGLDVHKESTAVAVAEPGWGEARDVGIIPTTADAVAKLVRKLGGKEGLVVAYEAGPCGYGIYRQLRSMGVECQVVAPSLIPRRPGDRVKTDKRDARQLARLLRSGELTPVWVPDEEHEALRDLVRAREDARKDLTRKRHQLGKFLLRNDVRPPEGVRAWSGRHRRWLEAIKLAQPAQAIVLAESLAAVTEPEDRIKRLETEMAWFAERSAHRPVIRALQALRGVSLITALALVVELGDITRFDRPEQLMSYAGLVPSEYSSGSSRHQGGITKTGNNHLRWLLIEASWHYRHQPRVGQTLRKRQSGLPEEVKRIAWKAQTRLNHKFRRMVGRGKPANKAVVAVARELLGFVWAIAHEVRDERLSQAAD